MIAARLLALCLLVLPGAAFAQGTPQLLLGEEVWGDPDVTLPSEREEASPLAKCLADPSDWQSCDLAEQSMRDGGFESTGDRVLEVGVLTLGPREEPAAAEADPALPRTTAAAAAPAAATARRLPVIEADIFFQYDSAEFVAGEEDKVERFAKAMRDPATEGLTFLVLGHTDSRGSETYNCQLSARRAAALTDALKARGVTARPLVALGVGEAMPRDPADTAAPVNRRVSFAPLRPADMATLPELMALCR
jgi:outer membrane protein OmpA-like peptidoglycan-associated protein